jgi:hypothetical protein
MGSYLHILVNPSMMLVNTIVFGALQYCSLTRLEIAYSVNQLYQHLHTPTTAHWTSAKCVLRYLKRIVGHCLYFTLGSLDFHPCTDSDWGGNLDDHNSTTGYGVLLGLSYFLM